MRARTRACPRALAHSRCCAFNQAAPTRWGSGCSRGNVVASSVSLFWRPLRRRNMSRNDCGRLCRAGRDDRCVVELAELVAHFMKILHGRVFRVLVRGHWARRTKTEDRRRYFRYNRPKRCVPRSEPNGPTSSVAVRFSRRAHSPWSRGFITYTHDGRTKTITSCNEREGCRSGGVLLLGQIATSAQRAKKTQVVSCPEKCEYAWEIAAVPEDMNTESREMRVGRGRNQTVPAKRPGTVCSKTGCPKS